MKKLNSAIALFVCIVILAFSFASCGKKKNNVPSTDAATTPATTPATDKATTPAATDAATTPATDKATEPATEPATDPVTEPATEPATTAAPDDFEKIAKEVNKMSDSMRSFKISYDAYTYAERVAKNAEYVRGPDTVEDGVTPSIQEMVYKRNKNAVELLGLSIEYSAQDTYGWGNQASKVIQPAVQGNDPDAPDLFIAMLYDLNIVLKTVGAFKNIKSLTQPNAYFNFDTQGWMKSWMESLSFTGDRAYVLGSDYFLDILRAMGVLPFNMDMMDANADKLATAILGDDEELDGEALSTYFFDLVEAGDWTWELLGKLCTAIYVDADADGQDSINDTLGIITDQYSGMAAALIIFSTGENTTETYTIEDPSSQYNGKTWVKYSDSAAVLGDIFEAVSSVFKGAGSFVTNDTSMASDSVDNPGIPYHHIKFANNELLFVGPSMLGTLELEAFQSMDSTYSVVPMPKVDASKEYNTIIHNTADAGAINVQTRPAKVKAISAFIQYCTQNSSEIREELLEIVTKYKTTSYDQGTDRMLDLIYENVVNARDKTIEDTAEGKSAERFNKMMMDDAYTRGRDYIEGEYEGIIGTKNSRLDELLEQWYTLPQ